MTVEVIRAPSFSSAVSRFFPNSVFTVSELPANSEDFPRYGFDRYETEIERALSDPRPGLTRLFLVEPDNVALTAYVLVRYREELGGDPVPVEYFALLD